mgnify:FL=1
MVEKKKLSKSDKLYSKSPSIKKDKDGKTSISKPKEADAEDMGIAGDNIQGEQTQMPVQTEQLGETHSRHQTEMKDMGKRHTDEVKDMHKRHAKEMAKHYGKE